MAGSAYRRGTIAGTLAKTGRRGKPTCIGGRTTVVNDTFSPNSESVPVDNTDTEDDAARTHCIHVRGFGFNPQSLLCGVASHPILFLFGVRGYDGSL
jgi:hypothetical protein